LNILFYYPFNKRTIPIDVPLFELKKRGHNLKLLTMSGKGLLHNFYEKEHIETFTHKKESRIGQVIELVRFCKKHKIDVVHSHLQQTNLVASIATRIMKRTRVSLFRHHCKFHYLDKKSKLKPPIKEVVADRLINILAKQIIVPSSGVRNAMIEHEGVKRNKIGIIPYMYHFNRMSDIASENVRLIRDQYPAQLRIIMVSRITPFKRHKVALEAVIKHLNEGANIQMLIMDEGPEMDSLKLYVKEAGLEKKIHFLGFQTNILDYIASADLILHPSLTDASNSAIKEAALFEKIVAVCDKVGDFNDYIQDSQNGFLLQADRFAEQAYLLIKKMIKDEIPAKEIGAKLKKIVVEKFSFDQSIVDKYEAL